jgi:hypothetical protein
MQRESTNNPYMWGSAEYLYTSTKQWLQLDARKRNLVSPKTGEPFDVDQL